MRKTGIKNSFHFSFLEYRNRQQLFIISHLHHPREFENSKTRRVDISLAYACIERRGTKPLESQILISPPPPPPFPSAQSKTQSSAKYREMKTASTPSLPTNYPSFSKSSHERLSYAGGPWNFISDSLTSPPSPSPMSMPSLHLRCTFFFFFFSFFLSFDIIPSPSPLTKACTCVHACVCVPRIATAFITREGKGESGEDQRTKYPNIQIFPAIVPLCTHPLHYATLYYAMLHYGTLHFATL